MITDWRTIAYYQQSRPEPPAWPERDPIPEVLSTDPWPDGVVVPRAVQRIETAGRAAGHEVRHGYSRGPERAIRVGTYKMTEAIGVWAAPHPAHGWRWCAIYGRTVGKTWAWRSVSIWLPGHGTRFTHALITDLEQWLPIAPANRAWFKGIEARETDKADRQRAAARNRPRTAKEGSA